MKYTLLSILLLVMMPSVAQTNTDSLLAAAKKADPATATVLLQKAHDIALQQKNEPALKEVEFMQIFLMHRYGSNDSAYLLINQKIKNISPAKEPTLLSRYYSLLGNWHMRNNDQKKALENFYKSLELSENDPDPIYKVRGYVNIGWALMELNQFEASIEQSKKAVAIVEKNNIDNTPSVYNNIASCYGALGKLDSAQLYVEKGIVMAAKGNDAASQANGLNILAEVYMGQNKKQEALDAFLKAISIREKAGDLFYVVSDLCSISSIYTSLGQHDKAIASTERALAIAKESKIDAKMPLIYQSLAYAYEGAGKYKEAATAFKKLGDLKDSLYHDASPKALAEMQTKYETEKKERQIQEQKFELAKKNYWIAASILLLLFAVLFGVSYYKRNQLKQAAALQQAINKQQELATRAVLEAEENERQRIAKDLHDGVGQMMSAAKMNLSAFESEIQFHTPVQKDAFERIITLVDDSCKEVRTVSHNMMPNALLKNSLAAAIRDFISKLDQRALQVQLYTEGLDERLDSNVETVLYRVIQECVNNVIKHAGASRLDIAVIKDANGISATVEDNGKGFDTSDLSKNGGMGLKNITARVEYLKGTVDFDSTAGKGTLVAIHVPV